MRADQNAAIPEISSSESFDTLVHKLAVFFTSAITSPSDFDELRNVVYERHLRPLVKYLVEDLHHEAVVCALLALREHFSATKDDDDGGLNETRGLACEIVAGRFVSHLAQREAIEYLCRELPSGKLGDENAIRSSSEDGHGSANGSYSLEAGHDRTYRTEAGHGRRIYTSEADERQPLLDGNEHTTNSFDEDSEEQDDDASATDTQASFATTFAGLNALEIAAVVGAKMFLSQKPIQRIINGIWKGDIVFWDTLSTHSVKEARTYSKDRSDPFCRLRVPLYLKLFEILFFAAFLALYYAVLVEKSPSHSVTAAEVMLYVWLTAFAYNELGEFWDAGITFYATDFWSSWDLGIIATGVAFFITRMVGIADGNQRTTDTAFDILAVEALFLVPRIFSLLSLHPYFGMLIPALKEMTKDFIKFLGLVAILYLGFDTTFTFLARGTYTFGKLNWTLINVFFGSSYLDIAEEISPILGPPLMLIFVCMTNILLITSLISLLSLSLDKVMKHARDEYLLVYSVYVLESANSNRLTYFLPPLNLLALLLRPLRLVLPAETMRSLRIILLKATHWPVVALILGYETWRLQLEQRRNVNSPSLLVRGPKLPNTRRKLQSGRSTQKPLFATGTRISPLVGEAHGAARTPVASPVPAPQGTMENLDDAVANLKAQIEAISTIIAKEREANSIAL